jgi:hypothetical protein
MNLIFLPYNEFHKQNWKLRHQLMSNQVEVMRRDRINGGLIASTSSVEAGTSSSDDVEGSSGSSSSPSKPYSSSSTKILSSFSLSPAHSKTSRGQVAVSSKVTSHDSTMVLVSRLNTL